MAPASSPSPHNGFNLPPCNPYSSPYPSPYPHPYHAVVPPLAANGGGPVVAPPVSNSYGSMTVPPVGNVGGPVAASLVGDHGGKVMGAPPVVGGPEAMWLVGLIGGTAMLITLDMDYACGAGGADCAAIRPNGSCYVPDSVVAHASYAFNSYWQKNKKNGGMCGFQGTAMLITSDPSKNPVSIFEFS
ncbi:glucan endo-1,3-beta-glucosidase 1 [Tanacetum coccineum]